MSKFFIDCGANIGQSVDKFRKSHMFTDDFRFYCFEPVSYLAKEIKDRKDDKIEVIEKAVWLFDGEIDFYLNKPEVENHEEGTIFKNEEIENLETIPTKVQCIDFSKWIEDTFSMDDYLILKLDIEGAEYDVIDKMLHEGSIDYINKIFTEWHFKRLGMEEEIHDVFLNRLKEVKGLRVRPDFGRLHLKKGRGKK